MHPEYFSFLTGFLFELSDYTLEFDLGSNIGENIMERKGFQSKGRDYDREREPGREPQKMYKARCSECNEETEVPFKPDPDRPVYCRQCYAKRKSRKF